MFTRYHGIRGFGKGKGHVQESQLQVTVDLGLERNLNVQIQIQTQPQRVAALFAVAAALLLADSAAGKTAQSVGDTADDALRGLADVAEGQIVEGALAALALRGLLLLLLALGTAVASGGCLFLLRLGLVLVVRVVLFGLVGGLLLALGHGGGWELLRSSVVVELVK